MYSILPAPFADWESANMRYIMVFFPFVGIFIGAGMYFLIKLCLYFNISAVFFAALAACLPVILSGGIHMDGFIDTADALGSNAEPEKRLEILKDPRTGAFGVLACGLYLVLSLGIWHQYFQNPVYPLSLLLVFTIPRILTALFVVRGKAAKNSGLLHLFKDSADRKASFVILFALLLGFFVLGFDIDIYFGLAVILVSALISLVFSRRTSKLFGGLTGDLAGFLTVFTELALLFTLTAFSAVI